MDRADRQGLGAALAGTDKPLIVTSGGDRYASDQMAALDSER